MRNTKIAYKLESIKKSIKNMIFANHINFQERIDEIILNIDTITKALESMEDNMYVKKQGKMYYLGNGERICYAYCPTCDYELTTKSFNKSHCTAFCKQCGQKIKWNKESEENK